MGLLDGVLGSFLGAEGASLVTGAIEQHGGLQGIVSQLQAGGLAGAVNSWISPGENQAVSPGQLQQALGPQAVEAIAARLGVAPDDLTSKLSTLLPSVIDRLTPNGVLPPT